MDGADFDALTRTLLAPSRRGVLRWSGAGLLAGGVALARREGALARCPRRRRCGKRHCCRKDQLCGHGATKRCVTGQGTCITGSNVCEGAGNHSCASRRGETPDCRCYQGIEGTTRCGQAAVVGGCGSCATSADCQATFPTVPGVFCATGAPECCGIGQNLCVAPCP